MEQIKLRLTGTSPMLHHNVRLVDPLDEHTRALSAAAKEAKSKKTDASHRTLARVEFEAGLYWDEKLGPYAPSTWVLKSLRDAAALTKQGKGIERGVTSMEDMLPLKYRGPRDVDGMWEAKMYDRRAIGVSTSKTMRTRPKFIEWALDVAFMFEPELIGRETLIAHAQQAGAFMGIGDARRLRFGRFEVEAA